MKKVWIGAGITILLIIIANITAQKLVPDRAVPIRVFAACLCVLIPSVIVLIILVGCTFENVKERGPKGKRDIKETLFLAFFTLLFLASMIFLGIRGTKAMKDIISGPIEQPIHRAYVKDRRERQYKSYTTNHYLICRTYDEKNEQFEVRINESELDNVKTVMSNAFDVYGLDGKYVLSYYENLKILEDFRLLEEASD